MILAILTRVNPVEGSVVRPQFLHTPLGRPIATFLLITSLPGWTGVMVSAGLGPPIQHPVAVWVEFLLPQIVTYWVLGKVISIAWRRWSTRRNGPGF